MMNKEQIIFVIILLLLFSTVIVGTCRKWKIFVDPPEEWRYYNLSQLKRLFGKDFLKWYNYFVGIGGVIFCLYFLLDEFLSK